MRFRWRVLPAVVQAKCSDCHVEAGTTQGSAAELALGEVQVSPARWWDHFDPTQSTPGPRLLGTSTMVPVGMSEDAWIAAYQAPQVEQAGRGCIPERASWEPVTVDGRSGGFYVGCEFAEAVVFVDGRVYIFSYVMLTGSQSVVETSGRPLLEAFIATVTLHPERVPEASAETD